MKIDSIFATFDRKIEETSYLLDADVPLNKKNNDLIRMAYKAYTRLLVDVSQSTEPVYLWGLVSSFYRMVKTIPILRLQALLDILHDYFILHERDQWSFQHFKGAFAFCDVEISLEEKKLLWPVYNNVINLVLRQGLPMLPDLASVCKFFSKLELDRPELEDECISSYYKDEEWLRSKPEPSKVLVSGMNQVLREWLSGYNPTFLPVQHGGGSVADARPNKWDKYNALGTDQLLRTGIKWLHGYEPTDYYPQMPDKPFIRTSKYITVPKSLKKRRGISMEPATLQYFQQGVMTTLYDYIGRNIPQIPLRDQTVNQRYAELGSVQGYFCTIDLSSASDLVSYQLVKDLFRGTQLLKYQICTRSNHTKMPTGDVVELAKFAPMGSALCFPTESLVFASCCEFLRRSIAKRGEYREILYSTYGDDIIINNSYYQIVADALTELGFRVNQEKSFFSGPFRESCGGNYYHGIDVTPMKYRLTITSRYLNPTDYSAICSLVNQAAERGYFQLRKYLLGFVIQTNPGPLFVDHFGESPAIWSPTPTNFNNKIRWNSDYQRAEVRYLGIATKPDRSVSNAMQGSSFCSDDVLYLERQIEREYFPLGRISEYEVNPYNLRASTTGYRRLSHLL